VAATPCACFSQRSPAEPEQRQSTHRRLCSQPKRKKVQTGGEQKGRNLKGGSQHRLRRSAAAGVPADRRARRSIRGAGHRPARGAGRSRGTTQQDSAPASGHKSRVAGGSGDAGSPRSRSAAWLSLAMRGPRSRDHCTSRTPRTRSIQAYGSSSMAGALPSMASAAGAPGAREADLAEIALPSARGTAA